MSEELLLSDEVARLLRVHRRTVLRMIGRGDFPGAFRVGWSWRIPAGDVKQYVEEERWERRAAASTSGKS